MRLCHFSEPTHGPVFAGVVAAMTLHAAVFLVSPSRVVLPTRAAAPEFVVFEAMVVQHEAPGTGLPKAAQSTPVRRAPRAVSTPRRNLPARPNHVPKATPVASASALTVDGQGTLQTASVNLALDGLSEANGTVVRSPAAGIDSQGSGTAMPHRALSHTPGAGTQGKGTVPARLGPNGFHCAWPAEAEYEDVHEQVVELRVLVATDGRVEQAELVSDPGYGFGSAARDCARRTRFTPARDGQGRLIRAFSPPLRVRFVR